MDNNEVIEGSRLISEFMNLEWLGETHINDKHTYIGIKDGLFESEANYHSSWDWLMPVVEKIKDLTDNIGKAPNPQSLKVWMEMNKEYFKVTALPLATPINEVWESVINFIKWYKTTNLK